MELKGTTTRKHQLSTRDERGIPGALEVSSEPGAPAAEVSIPRSTRWLSAQAPTGPMTFEQVREGERVMALFGEASRKRTRLGVWPCASRFSIAEYSPCKSR